MASATPSITHDTTSVHKLGNGITVLLEPLPYLRSASAGIWIKTGSANERPEQCGMSHFLEHLFFKGTTTRSARQLVEAIESRGGHLNAFTSRDYTCLYAKMLGEHVGTAIEILADILKNSQFYDFEKERNVVLEEIASIEDVPEDHVHDLLVERLWPDHALGRPITGTEQTLGAMTVEDVRAYFAEWYRPENLIISVAGSFDEEILLEQISREFESIEAPSALPRPTPPVFGGGTGIVERDVAQNHLCVGFPGPGIHDERRYVYNMLSSILGGGSTSRLFDTIREQEGLAYSIYTFHSSYWDSGMMGLYAAVAPENLDKTIALSFAELKRVCQEPLSEVEITLNREQLKGGMLMALESTFNRMARMSKSYMYHGRILAMDEIVAAIDAVSADAIQRLAQERFTPEQCAMVILGPGTNGNRYDKAPL
jgi:predicted Zn-dependent peptidase